MTKLRVLALLLFLAGCSAGGALSLLTGGGPNVAANTQLGQNNEQVLGLRNSDEQSIGDANNSNITQTADKTQVKSDSVERVNITNIPPWVLLLLVLGWLLPSPAEIGRGIKSWFHK